MFCGPPERVLAMNVPLPARLPALLGDNHYTVVLTRKNTRIKLKQLEMNFQKFVMILLRVIDYITKCLEN